MKDPASVLAATVVSGPRTRSGRHGGRARRVGLLLAGIVLAVTAAEVGLALVRPSASGRDPAGSPAEHRFYRYHELLGWAGAPNARAVQQSQSFAVEVRLNAEGFRDRDVPVERSPGRRRIVVLGDSMTWGHGVAEGQRYPDVLETLLRRDGLDVEVVNLGMSGYGTDQQFLLFTTRGVHYRADLVIVGFFWNDLFENVSAAAYGYAKPRFVLRPSGELELTNVPVPRRDDDGSVGAARARGGHGPKGWLERHSHIYRLAADAVRGSALYDVATALGLAAGPRRDPESEEWKLTSMLLGRLKEAVTGAGAGFLVIVLPERRDLETGNHRLKAPLIGQLETLPGIDVTPALTSVGPASRLYYPRDIHLTAEGHEAVARAVAPRVRAALSRAPHSRPGVREEARGR